MTILQTKWIKLKISLIDIENVLKESPFNNWYIINNYSDTLGFWNKSDLSPFFIQGKFIGITGKVGAGKSSLFASITANMEKHDGFVRIQFVIVFL